MKSQRAVVTVWVVFGVLMFGPALGLVLINTDDISNHPWWNKALIVAASIIFAGPAWGYFSGLAFWHFLKRREEAAARAAARIRAQAASSEGR